MFNKKNPMRYFSGSTFVRLPLYKLAAGGTAVALAASIGLGAFAAGFTPFTAPEPSPTPVVTATPETAATPTPSPSPSPTPEPDKPLTLEASVIQQDVGVTLFVEPVTDEAAPAQTAAPDPDAEEEPDKTPLLGVEATVTLTDAKGQATDYPLDTETGTALAEDVTPGDYTVAVQPIEGYIMPEAQAVTVKEKVVYKADVQAVKEKIVQASQVNESAEDSGVSNAGSAPIANEVTDTVTYADSARTEVGTKTTYTAKTEQHVGSGTHLSAKILHKSIAESSCCTCSRTARTVVAIMQSRLLCEQLRPSVELLHHLRRSALLRSVDVSRSVLTAKRIVHVARQREAAFAQLGLHGVVEGLSLRKDVHKRPQHTNSCVTRAAASKSDNEVAAFALDGS